MRISGSQPRTLFLVSVLFAGAILLTNRLILLACTATPFDCPPYWPLSVFYPRAPEPGHLLTGIAVFGLFLAAARQLGRSCYRLRDVMLWSLILVLGSNFIQGWERGFAVPVAGEPLYWTVSDDGIEYYHDALAVTDPQAFIAGYVALQPDLRVHSKTHPPGAVLALWLLSRMTPDPAIIALLIATIAVCFSAWALRRLLQYLLEDDVSAGYGTWLYFLIPAVQIYGAASLDALIAAFLLVALAGFVALRGWRGLLIAFAGLWCASFLSFGAMFLLPVLLGFTWIERRSFGRCFGLAAALLAAYALLYLLSGFDYLASFSTAARLENPNGFRLLAEPLSYAVTRLENVLELLVFFGPFLTLLAFRGRRSKALLAKLARLGLGVLLLMFATGAFRTGETARACLFIYPYLLLLALGPLQDRHRNLWAGLVFGQTVVMQLFGVYFW